MSGRSAHIALSILANSYEGRGREIIRYLKHHSTSKHHQIPKTSQGTEIIPGYLKHHKALLPSTPPFPPVAL